MIKNEFAPFTIEKPIQKLYNKICKIVFDKFGLVCENIDVICDDRHGKPKTYKLSIKNASPMRLDIKHQKEKTELQLIVNKYDIEIPKIINVYGKYKFSEWIDGLMLSKVVHIPEVFVASGDMMARLNLIQIDNKFVSNSEFSLTNAIWTKDKKIYIIDQGKMNLYDNTDISIIQVLMKRIRNKKNISFFLEGYSRYKDITNIQKLLTKYNYDWKNYVSRRIKEKN